MLRKKNVWEYDIMRIYFFFLKYLIFLVIWIICIFWILWYWNPDSIVTIGWVWFTENQLFQNWSVISNILFLFALLGSVISWWYAITHCVKNKTYKNIKQHIGYFLLIILLPFILLPIVIRNERKTEEKYKRYYLFYFFWIALLTTKLTWLFWWLLYDIITIILNMFAYK